MEITGQGVAGAIAKRALFKVGGRFMVANAVGVPFAEHASRARKALRAGEALEITDAYRGGELFCRVGKYDAETGQCIFEAPSMGNTYQTDAAKLSLLIGAGDVQTLPLPAQDAALVPPDDDPPYLGAGGPLDPALVDPPPPGETGTELTAGELTAGELTAAIAAQLKGSKKKGKKPGVDADQTASEILKKLAEADDE